VEEDFYSVDEAARILKLTPGRIRQMLRAGELEGIAPEEGGRGPGRGWKIPMHAVHDLDRPARVQRPPEAPESPERLWSKHLAARNQGVCLKEATMDINNV
jgi:excisionase family DNA binding protein